ncbi:MAG: TRAP transporter small permease subunit [Hydrococcus sp. C42_A2020_068]|uniref:TRAP transporter small permease subunit n=1 Tax=Pleurocapsa sp. PCC 7327 TaxID=118163 RepID=UPI00029FA14E|nr:TRAP transporter small permease subunit [Pleurocapsa sp. PCC 7327]AFY76615.1 TRAP-type mannitol/chloroaromatic compound transport system, small permease component [Pleurocapsa sp. PCC 7327]MBF2021637.1 TRAP transporter small permease subunit [Hydrococcus sp. C42_A2020_068]
MHALLRLSSIIDRAIEKIGGILNWIVILTIAVGFYNVVARYVGRFIGLKLSSNALIELQWYLFSIIFCLGFAYILKHGANVRVDFLYANWSEKQRSLVDFIGTILFLIPFCAIGIWATFNPILLSWGLLPDGTWGTWEVSSDADGLPRAPIKTMILVAFLLLLLQSISQAIKYFAILMGYAQVAQVVEAETEKNLPIE